MVELRDFYHWRCDCGAYGNSNAWDANVLIIRLHRERGHTVTSWPRGQPKETQTLGPLTQRDDG